MSPRALARLRSLITLVVLLVVLLVAAAWGWSNLTSPFPTTEEAPVCDDVTIAAGEPVTPESLVVNVVNAGERVGLAASTMNALETRGFARGSASDAADGTEVATVEIWSADPTSPAVRLVSTYLGKNVSVVDRTVSAPGITIVVGDKFQGVTKGRKRIVPRQDTTVCAPTAPETPTSSPTDG